MTIIISSYIIPHALIIRSSLASSPSSACFEQRIAWSRCLLLRASSSFRSGRLWNGLQTIWNISIWSQSQPTKKTFIGFGLEGLETQPDSARSIPQRSGSVPWVRPYGTNHIPRSLDWVTCMDSLNLYMELIRLGNEARETKKVLINSERLLPTLDLSILAS